MSNSSMKLVDRKQNERLIITSSIEDELLRIATKCIFDYNEKHDTDLMVYPKDGNNSILPQIKILKQITLLSGVNNKKAIMKKYAQEPKNPVAYTGFSITENNFFFKDGILYLYNGSTWTSKFTGGSGIDFAPGVFKKAGMCPDLSFYNMGTERWIVVEHKEQQAAGNADERFFRWHAESEMLHEWLNVPADILPYVGIFTGEQVKCPGTARAITNSFDEHIDNYLLIEDIFLDTSEDIIYNYFYESVIPQLVK